MKVHELVLKLLNENQNAEVVMNYEGDYFSVERCLPIEIYQTKQSNGITWVNKDMLYSRPVLASDIVVEIGYEKAR